MTSILYKKYNKINYLNIFIICNLCFAGTVSALDSQREQQAISPTISHLNIPPASEPSNPLILSEDEQFTGTTLPPYQLKEVIDGFCLNHRYNEALKCCYTLIMLPDYTPTEEDYERLENVFFGRKNAGHTVTAEDCQQLAVALEKKYAIYKNQRCAASIMAMNYKHLANTYRAAQNRKKAAEYDDKALGEAFKAAGKNNSVDPVYLEHLM